jgi:hypothetical protein
MNNLVFISGDFSSGTTLMWQLFRHTNQHYCLYEPLHERLLEYLIWPLRPYEHHYFVKSYFAEYKGFNKIPKLFSPPWGTSQLYLPAKVEANDLHRYLSYLIGTAFGRSDRVVLKENRITFRLAWLRENFPQAKIIHIYRERDSQWKSIVRRSQAYFHREDVDQDKVTFNGMSIARWCDDLQSTYPELASENSQSGYERFCKLWELSYQTNCRFADISINYSNLINDFETVCGEIWKCIGYDYDIASLKKLIISSENQKPVSINSTNYQKQFLRQLDNFGLRLARLIIRLRNYSS